MRHRWGLAIGVAAVALGCVVVGTFRGVDAAELPVHGVRLAYGVDVRDGADRDAALAHAVRVVRDRLDARGFAGPVAVRVAGDQLVVELAGADEDAIQHARRLLPRATTAELQLVVDGSETARWVSSRVATDPEARAGGIGTDVERWMGPDGDAHHDHFVRADDRRELVPADEAARRGCTGVVQDGQRSCVVPGRVRLEQFLERQLQADPSRALPDRQRFGYERVDGPGTAPGWRTYLLDGITRIDGRAIIDVQLSYDTVTNRPLVVAQLDPAAARAFEQLTADHPGRKLAIVLDGLIATAPVIQAAIPGGELQIAMGAGDPRQREREAQDLVAALRAGSMPFPLVLESVERFDAPPRGFLAAAWPFYLAAAALALALALAAVLVVGRSRGAPVSGT